MTVYFVTGKLGAGKSLSAVGRIREAFFRGVPVATNLDINLSVMLGRKNKKARLIRLPDKPDIQDMHALGNGNKSYDEKKNGLIVLDECGTWFNSRTWNDRSRQEVINWMLHARKLGWDIIFIVQDIAIVDKQARLALGEHVVFCRRLDRVGIPMIGAVVSLLTLGLVKLRLPKIHLGIVKYGDNPNTALTVDKWLLMGTDLYHTYDTKQAFSDHYAHRAYTVLPPYYTHGRYAVPYTLRNLMRLTKIHFKRFSRPFAFALGMVFAAGAFWISQKSPVEVMTNAVAAEIGQASNVSLDEMFSGYRITRFSNFPGAPVSFVLTGANGSISSHEIAEDGVKFEIVSKCHVTLIAGSQRKTLYC